MLVQIQQFPPNLGVAQSGRAPALGAGGRGFEALLRDQIGKIYEKSDIYNSTISIR